MDPRPLARLAAAWAACATLFLCAVPVASRVAAGGAALGFLRGFLAESGAGGALPDPSPTAVPLAPGLAGRHWRPPQPPYPGIVLVHGLTPEGKDDERLGRAAALLARTGRAVLAPDLPGLRAQRLDPTDAAAVTAAVERLAADPATRRDPVTVVAVSVGAGPALAAAADPATGARVRLVVTLGAYAEARELIRRFTTGQPPIDPAVVREFLAGNLELVRDPADRAAVAAWLRGAALPAAAGVEARAVVALLENRDPARVDALIAALPDPTRALLDAVSPVRVVARLRPRLLLVHGRDDPAVPYTESRRLAAAADPRRTRLVLVDLVAHVEGRTAAWRQARDVLKLWSAVYAVVRG